MLIATCLSRFFCVLVNTILFFRRPSSTTSTGEGAAKKSARNSKPDSGQVQRTPTQSNSGQSCLSPRTPDSLPSPSVAVTTSPSIAPSIRFTDSVLSYRSSATALSRTKNALTPTRKLDHSVSKSDNSGRQVFISAFRTKEFEGKTFGFDCVLTRKGCEIW